MWGIYFLFSVRFGVYLFCFTTQETSGDKLRSICDVTTCDFSLMPTNKTQAAVFFSFAVRLVDMKHAFVCSISRNRIGLFVVAFFSEYITIWSKYRKLVCAHVAVYQNKNKIELLFTIIYFEWTMFNIKWIISSKTVDWLIKDFPIVQFILVVSN